jgi:8-amino-3,8-dideoxy-alpha-D-manno-octulosonate transaminase
MPPDPKNDPTEKAIHHPLPPMYPGGMRIDEEEEQAVLDVIRSRRLFRYYGPNPGPSQVEAFEQAFCQHMGTKYAVAVTSGTAALICGLVGLGVGPGDEVIVPAYTWIASASAVVAVGAVPVLAEVDESLTLDPEDLERKITPYTKAVIPVHMRGAPCQMDRIMQIARRHNLKVLEDAAQANGGSYQGRRLGTWGDAGAFSLQFNKIITSGEGGVVITDQETVWKRVVMYHDVIGGERNHIPEAEILPGVNYRMPELLGAVALVQLKRLDGLLVIMRRNKQVLKESMAAVARRKGVTFRPLNDSEGDAGIALVFFAPDAASARQIGAGLAAEGAEPWLLYSPEAVDYHVYPHWSPIMGQRAWTPEGGPWRNHPRQVTYTREMCPRTLDLLGRAVHLDVSPELTSENLEELADALNIVLETL